MTCLQEQGAISWPATPEIGLWGRGRLGTWGAGPAWLGKNGIFRNLVLPTLAGFWGRTGLGFMSGGRVEFEICEIWCWDWGGNCRILHDNPIFVVPAPSGHFCGSTEAQGGCKAERQPFA